MKKSMKISGKSASTQRKTVHDDVKNDEPIRPTSIRSLERQDKKKKEKKRRRIGKIESNDRKDMAFAKS